MNTCEAILRLVGTTDPSLIDWARQYENPQLMLEHMHPAELAEFYSRLGICRPEERFLEVIYQIPILRESYETTQSPHLKTFNAIASLCVNNESTVAMRDVIERPWNEIAELIRRKLDGD